MPSTFYDDGYRDALNGTEQSPVDQGIYGGEYQEGFNDGQLALQAASTRATSDQQELQA